MGLLIDNCDKLGLRCDDLYGLHENICTDCDAHEKPDHENKVGRAHDEGGHQRSAWNVDHAGIAPLLLVVLLNVSLLVNLLDVILESDTIELVLAILIWHDFLEFIEVLVGHILLPAFVAEHDSS